MSSVRIPTIRSRLALLVAACLVPAVLMLMLLIAHDYRRERSKMEHDAIATARAIASLVDRDLGSVEAKLFALATSPHLGAGNFSAFYDEAQAVLRNLGGNNIVLAEEDGTQVFNTFLPFGQSPKEKVAAAQWRELFLNGRPVLSDLFRGPATGRPLLALGVPVLRGGKVAYNLSEGIFPERLSKVLAEQRLPPGWVAEIFDSSGTVVARSRDVPDYLGKKAPQPLLLAMAGNVEGAIETDTDQGGPVLSAYSRSAVSKWTVVIGIARQDLLGELWHSLWKLVLAAVLLLACSLGCAWFIGGRIAAAVRGLTMPAMALGFGSQVAIPALRLREADEVGRALVKASDMLLNAQHRAHHDALTGLANRALFDRIVEQQLTVCQRTGTHLSILYIDLDEFKAINDTHGHAIGDELLRAVALRLKACVRGSDVAARLGGDEFALVLLYADLDAAAAVAAKLVESLDSPFTLGELTLAVSASIGVAEYPASGASAAALLRNADDAMYRAKSAGLRYSVATPP